VWKRNGTQANRQSAVELKDCVAAVSTAHDAAFQAAARDLTNTTPTQLLLLQHTVPYCYMFGPSTGFIFSELTPKAAELVMAQAQLAFSGEPVACQYRVRFSGVTRREPAAADYAQFTVQRDGGRERWVRVLLLPQETTPRGLTQKLSSSILARSW